MWRSQVGLNMDAARAARMFPGLRCAAGTGTLMVWIQIILENYKLLILKVFYVNVFAFALF